MAGPPLAILQTGLMTSVGLSAPAACAAIRSNLTNHTETKFVNRAGERIMAAQVPLDQPWRGTAKLLRMVAPAIAECLEGLPASELASLPLLLCVAENEREGRFDEIDARLINEISSTLNVGFDARLSAVIPYGRVGVPVALSHARRLVQEHGRMRVVVAAVDSLLVAGTLGAIEQQGRLLAPDNSNGFIPGEAAGALLFGTDTPHEPRLFCTGVGFAEEASTIVSEEPLRAAGLTAAVKQALGDANCDLNDLDFRLTDISGEQYYFKEAALTYSRIARSRKEAFEMWHPADCIGETGAAIGAVALAVADAACRKGYARGPGILFHCGNDAGQRAAVVLRWGAPQ